MKGGEAEQEHFGYTIGNVLCQQEEKYGIQVLEFYSPISAIKDKETNALNFEEGLSAIDFKIRAICSDRRMRMGKIRVKIRYKNEHFRINNSLILEQKKR